MQFWHTVELLAPTADDHLPGAHPVQALTVAGFGPYVPAVHGKHVSMLVRAVAFPNVPAAQGVQDAADDRPGALPQRPD
jgi:hypothetical protein